MRRLARSVHALTRLQSPLRGWRFLAELAFVAAVTASTARAQDVPGKTEESEGEVSLFEAEREASVLAATKTQIPVSKAPGAVTVITDREIQLSGARTIGDLLRVVAGVEVRWNTMVQMFTIRGFGENPFTSRVLLLIDGIPYNAWDKGGFPEHPGLDFFSPENIKRLEIIRSPQATLYGEDAFWGVINIVTLSGTDLRGGDVAVYGGSRDTIATTARYGDALGKSSSLLVTAKYQDTVMPREFWLEEDARNKALDVFAKAVFGGLQLSYYRYQSGQDGFSKPLLGPNLPAIASVDEIKQTINIASAKFEQSFDKDSWSLGGDFAYENRYGHHCAACHGPGRNAGFLNQVDHGYQLAGELRAGVRKIPHNDLLIGVDFRRRDAGDHRFELLPPAPGRNVVLGYNRVATYAQDRITLADDKLDLYLGARYDFETDLFDSFVSPRANFVYSASKSVVLRGGWSEARRIPNFFELYQDGWFLSAGNIPLGLFGGNPQIQPEKIDMFELGGEVRLARNVSLKLDLYRSRVRDFIVIDRPGDGPAEAIHPVNHPDTGTILGGELELRGQIGHSLTGFVNYAYEDVNAENGTLSPDGAPLEVLYAPKNKFNVGAYFGAYSGFSGSFDLSWRDEVFAPIAWYRILASIGQTTSATPFPLESSTFINFRLSYDLPFDMGKVEKPVRLSVYGRNLLDETPIEYGDFPNLDKDQLAGREFYGEVAFRF